MKSWTQAMMLGGHRVDVELDYTKARADVVDFRFHGATVVTWSIGRELLTLGLSGRAGEGAIRIVPSACAVGIELNTPSGEAHVVFQRDHLVAFLKATYRRVPRGHEYDGVDWDLLLPTAGGAG